MLLYIMLYIVLAYLMLLAALTNAVCLNNASSSFFCHWFVQMLFIFMLCLCLLTYSLFISFSLFASCTVLLICLFFLIICSHRCWFFLNYFLWKGYELSGDIALKNNHYYYYYYSPFSHNNGTNIKLRKRHD